MMRNSTHRVFIIFPILIGTITFLLVTGHQILDPRNIAWLQDGDPAIHYLGWSFFRSTPYSFPIGLNPNYGLELSSSIVYSDSIPLLALAFRPISFLLPEPFQYFGVWLLLCFVLQACFAWKLLGLATNSQLLRLIGSGFFVFAPPMIWRMHGHLALAGHFLLVAGLYLALIPKLERRLPMWGALLLTSALTHAYLLAMVGALWLADLVGRTLKSELAIHRAVMEVTILVVIVGLMCWQAGYFSVGGGVVADGFGHYRMNILSMFDPSGWSFVLRDIPEAEGEYEGFNYLGLGVLLLFVISLPVIPVVGRSVIRVALDKFVLSIILVGFVVFAISNNVGLGSYHFSISLPDAIRPYTNVFRASGRFFWPVFYVAVLTAIALIIRGYERRVAVGILSFTLVVQILDSSPAWWDLRLKAETFQGSQWQTRLIDPFWADAAKFYSKVRYLPTQNNSPFWKELSYYAARYRIATDAVHLARVGANEVEAARQQGLTMLESGELEKDTLYVLSQGTFRSSLLKLDRNFDLLAEIDGLLVVAPGWKKCRSCPRYKTELPTEGILPPMTLSQQLTFSDASQGVEYLSSGWSNPEVWGTWSRGSVAEIFVPVSPDGVSSINLNANVLISPTHLSQRVVVLVNGVKVDTFTFKEPTVEFVVKMPDALKQDPGTGYLRIGFEFPDAARPIDIGLGNDTRTLALGLISLRLKGQ